MNRALLDPFQNAELPEKIEDTLDKDKQHWACCAAFNHTATLLAAGCRNGEVVIWDFHTRGIAAVWTGGHTLPVTSAVWSRHGRVLVTAGADKRVIRWNVEHGTPDAAIELDSPILSVSINARQPETAAVSLEDGPPVLVGFADRSVRQLPTVDVDVGKAATGQPPPTAALLSKDGSVVFVGQPRGVLTVVDASSLRILDIVKVPGPGCTRFTSLRLNRKGTLLLASSLDRYARLFTVDLPERKAGAPHSLSVAEAEQKIQAFQKLPARGSLLRSDAALRQVREFEDAVQKSPWSTAAFSHDSEHVAAASQTKSSQSGVIFIWDRLTGNHRKVLDLSKDRIVDLTWHPLQNIIVSVSGTTGQISVWAREYQENWTAFAPDFTELQVNEEYVEKETEFDVNEDDEQPPVKDERFDEDVDILEAADVPLYSSDDEADADALSNLPVIIEAVDPDPLAAAAIGVPAAVAAGQATAAVANGNKAAAPAVANGSVLAMEVDAATA